MSRAVGPAGVLEETREAADTPAVRQFWAAKRSHPECVLMFRMGDFFEMFGADAERAAPVLGVALTARAFGRSGRVAMCGVPHHSLHTYARKLLDAGIRVAVCDQVETPRPGKLVARRVVRVLSPGTLVEEGYLSPDALARCVAVVPGEAGFGLAALDVSTGSCQLGLVTGSEAGQELGYRLAALEAAELLVPAGRVALGDLGLQVALTERPPASFDPERGWRLLAGAGMERERREASAPLAAAALAGLADYCQEGELSLPAGFLRIAWQGSGEIMTLDGATRRNLELVQPQGAGRSLLRLLDRSATPLGARRLRSWVQEPLRDLERIHARQRAVAELAGASLLRRDLRDRLRSCRDLERLMGRCAHRVASPRDLQSLGMTLEALPTLAAALGSLGTEPLARVRAQLELPGLELAGRLRQALSDEAPAQVRDGGFIRDGYDPELDAIRGASAGAREYLNHLEERERERTGIRSLKVGYNRVFGYYIEVRNAARDALPPEYVRRQTLVGAERFVTAELREQENVVLTSRERSLAREQELLRELLEAVVALAEPIGLAASGLGELDAMQSLAEVGVELGWVMPEIDDGLELLLEDGRHPLVEDALGAGRFVPNDVDLDGEAARVWLLTGPNMAGKSTFLRQVATICLLGQLGSMVPCRQARWGVLDRIFTRVGAQDDLAAGRSTFMVEMEEMALILAQCSERSLLVLDEIGRGTSTYDGMSIAQAVLEHLHSAGGMARRVLFATHYHELTALERSLPALRNHRVEVVERGGEAGTAIEFLHRIVPGGADRSYGIHVARLAGLPAGVLARATEVLAEREADRPLTGTEPRRQQMPLPLEPRHPVMVELARVEVDGLTPLEALQKIAEWQRRAGEAS